MQRPFVYFYCPVFLLYELSSPFLNIHWFCDKLDLTGSIYQAINGAFLMGTFFCCRIVWGLYSSYNTFSDLYTAIAAGHSMRQPGVLGEVREMSTWQSGDLGLYYKEGEQATAFMGEEYLPLWMAGVYLASNLVLNMLNIWWFEKMVATIRKRFDPPFGTKGVGPDTIHYQPQEKVEESSRAMDALASAGQGMPDDNVEDLHRVGKGSVKAGRERAEMALNGGVDGTPEIQRTVYADGHKGVEVSGTTRRAAKSRRKA